MYNQNDSIGLAESPGSLGLDDEPASLTEAEFTGVETDVCRLRDRLGREVVRVEVEVAAFVGDVLEVSVAAGWAVTVEGEVKAPILGRRIFKVGVGFGAEPLVAGGVMGL